MSAPSWFCVCVVVVFGGVRNAFSSPLSVRLAHDKRPSFRALDMGPRVADNLLEGYDHRFGERALQQVLPREHLEDVEDFGTPGPPSVPGEKIQCKSGAIVPNFEVKPALGCPSCFSLKAAGQPLPLLLDSILRELQPPSHQRDIHPSSSSCHGSVVHGHRG